MWHSRVESCHRVRWMGGLKRRYDNIYTQCGLGEGRMWIVLRCGGLFNNWWKRGIEGARIVGEAFGRVNRLLLYIHHHDRDQDGLCLEELMQLLWDFIGGILIITWHDVCGISSTIKGNFNLLRSHTVSLIERPSATRQWPYGTCHCICLLRTYILQFEF